MDSDHIFDGSACEAGIAGRGAGAAVRQEQLGPPLHRLHAEGAVPQRPLRSRKFIG